MAEREPTVERADVEAVLEARRELGPSYDAALVDSFAERIVMIADGRIVADGTTAQIRSQASGRMVSADLRDDSAASALSALRALHHVVDATLQGHRVTVTSSQSDAVARALLEELGGSNLEITTGSLESAFMTITARSSAATDDNREASR